MGRVHISKKPVRYMPTWMRKNHPPEEHRTAAHTQLSIASGDHPNGQLRILAFEDGSVRYVRHGKRIAELPDTPAAKELTVAYVAWRLRGGVSR